MKAKRLTALALAALMAVSSATVALADPTNTVKMDRNKDGALRFYDTVSYYKYDDDEGTLIKVDRDAFKPGDTIYIPLYETSEKLTSNETFRVFDDIEIGKSWVDDVRFEYRRGDLETNTTTQYSYSFVGTRALAGWTIPETNTALTTEQAVREELKKRAEYEEAIVKYMDSQYPKVTGATDKDGNYYESVAKAKDSLITSQNNGTIYSYNGKTGASPEQVGLSETRDGAWVVNKKYYNDLPTALIYGIGAADPNKIESLSAGKIFTAEASVGYGSYATEKNENDGLNDLADTHAGKTVYTLTYNDRTYWCLEENVQALVNALIQTETPTIQSLANFANGVEYYWVSGTDTGSQYQNLVKKSSVVSNGTVYLYNGQSYSSEAEAVAAAGITEKNNGRKDGTKWISEFDARAKAEKQVESDFAASTVKVNSKQITSTDYRLTYWVRIDTEKSANTKENEVVGRIYVTPKSSLNSAKKDKSGLTDYIDIDVNLTNRDVGNDDFEDVDSDAYIEPGQRAVLSFADDADDVVIEFGDDAWYEFNARGQGRVNFAYNTNFDRDFAYDYDHANIDFINFVAEPTTNKTGTLYIYADEDSYIYEVTSKGAKKINGAYYDDDEGAWVIRTRHLTSYAISDRRLKTIDQMEDDKNSSSSSKPSGSQGSGSGNGNYKPIPDTGR